MIQPPKSEEELQEDHDFRSDPVDLDAFELKRKEAEAELNQTEAPVTTENHDPKIKIEDQENETQAKELKIETP